MQITVHLGFDGNCREAFERYRNILGGDSRVAFQPTFWSPGFGLVVDRFGTPWEVTSAEPPAGS